MKSFSHRLRKYLAALRVLFSEISKASGLSRIKRPRAEDGAEK